VTDNGFDVGLDILTSATISIHLMDAGGSEHYRFDIGTGPQTFTHKNVPGGHGSTDTITLNAASLADLAADGMISVKVSSTSGSFSFADSLLTAQGTEFVPPIGNVPGPSTLLLLGAGLAGLGWRFRRRS
jgi:PEP-CTERM motif